MGRKLASVQYVHDVWPIEGADKIECVGVLGWKCVAKKGEFKVGDRCVYFEIDSFLPVRPEFEFLRSSSYKNSELLGEGFRLRTQKFRGQISQGLCLPVGVFGEGEWVLGAGVTAELGVRKWEIEERASSSGTIVAGLPAGIPKTEETRVQSAPEVIGELAGHPYYITTKLDGTRALMNCLSAPAASTRAAPPRKASLCGRLSLCTPRRFRRHCPSRSSTTITCLRRRARGRLLHRRIQQLGSGLGAL